MIEKGWLWSTPLLDALPADSNIHHWGDIDAGGFRIADQIALVCRDANRELKLFNLARLTTGQCFGQGARGVGSVRHP